MLVTFTDDTKLGTSAFIIKDDDGSGGQIEEYQ
jgi:hypothetical protein